MGKVTFWVAPLSFHAKIEMESCTKLVAGVEVLDQVKRSYTCLKYSLKEVEGLKLSDGSEYELSFDPSGCLTDECVNEVMQADTSAALQLACISLVSSVEAHKIKGVEIDLGAVRPAKKKET